MKRRRTPSLSSAVFVFILFFVVVSGAKKSNVKHADGDVIEGSGSAPVGVDRNVVAADIDWEASGVGPDDEDGDVIEGSGSVPRQQQKHDTVEGSGLPAAPQKPVVIPDPPQKPLNVVNSVDEDDDDEEEEDDVRTTTKSTPASVAVGTTVITITKDQVGKDEFKPPHLDDDEGQELTFGVVPGQKKEQEEEEEDDDDEEEDSDEVTTTTVKQTTERTTTRKPVVAVVTEPSPDDVDVPISDSDPLRDMLRPGILAAITGGAVVGILLAILLIMFIVYRIRKKDEGSYSVDENAQHPPNYTYAYQKAATQEFYA